MSKTPFDYKPYHGRRRMHAVDYVCIFLSACIIVSCLYWAVRKAVSLSREMDDMQKSGTVYVMKSGEVADG